MKKIIPGLVVCAMYLNECMADNIHVPEYVDKVSGVKCMAFDINTDGFSSAAFSFLDDEENSYKPILINTLDKLKVANTADDIIDVANSLTVLSNVLPLEQQVMLEDIFLNLFIRAALMGNFDAMFSILSVSFDTPKERLSKIFIIEDVDLDFSELKEKLEAELDKSESPEAFKKVVCELKSHSAPASPIKNQLTVRDPSRPRSSSY